MTIQELIDLYIEAYESGAKDLYTINLWLKDKKIRFIAKNGKITKIKAI
jgi:hypothetical protein